MAFDDHGNEKLAVGVDGPDIGLLQVFRLGHPPICCGAFETFLGAYSALRREPHSRDGLIDLLDRLDLLHFHHDLPVIQLIDEALRRSSGIGVHDRDLRDERVGASRAPRRDNGPYELPVPVHGIR